MILETEKQKIKKIKKLITEYSWITYSNNHSLTVLIPITKFIKMYNFIISHVISSAYVLIRIDKKGVVIDNFQYLYDDIFQSDIEDVFPKNNI